MPMKQARSLWLNLAHYRVPYRLSGTTGHLGRLYLELVHWVEWQYESVQFLACQWEHSFVQWRCEVVLQFSSERLRLPY